MSSFTLPTRKTLGAAAALSVGMAAFLGTPAFAAETPATHATTASQQTAATPATSASPGAEDAATPGASASPGAEDSAPSTDATQSTISWPAKPIQIDSQAAGSVQVAPTSWKDVQSIALNTENVPAGWTVSADQATGVITVTWPKGVTEATEFQVPLTLAYTDGTKVAGAFTVGADVAKDTAPATQAADIVWESKMLTFTDQPGSQTIHVVNPKDWKNVKSFDLDRTKLPKGWTITGNPANGDVTVTWPANVPAGTAFTIPVVVTFQDGSTYKNAFALGNPAKDTTKPTTPAPTPGKSEPTMPAKPSQPGKSTTPATAAQQAKAISWDSKTLVFTSAPGSTVLHVVNKQDWKNVSSVVIDRANLPKGWTVSADAKTGDISVTWPANVPAGLSFRLPVTVNFADGSKFVTDLRLGNPTKSGSTATPAPAKNTGSAAPAAATSAQTPAPAMPASDQPAAAPAQAAPSAAPQQGLANTGAGDGTGLLLATGAGAVLLGAGAVVFARRRSA